MTGLARMDDPQPIAHLKMSATITLPGGGSLPCDTKAVAESPMGDGKDLGRINEWYPMMIQTRVLLTR